MAPPGPILVATDFSGHARHAATRAARLAHDTRSALTLVHILPAPPVTKIREWLGASSAREQKVCDAARRQLRQLASELTSVRRVEFDIEAAAGSAPDEIVRAAERVDARLLVLGARGAGFLRRLVLGTTSQRLVRRTDRPLLVVRQTANRSYRRVLVAVDFSPQSRHALILARRVAPNAKLVILTVFEVPFEGKIRFAGVDDATFEIYRQRARARALRQLHALAHEAGLSPSQWELSVVEGDASRRIVEQEQSRNCDLVVLAPHSQSAVADLLLGSVTRHVLAEGRVDVLLSTRVPGQPFRPWE
ncbi:MAG TPA: universal stress protein [Aggregatilineales bacterium]|nr:universal stress protein [Aggregatilineales bacterium]